MARQRLESAHATVKLKLTSWIVDQRIAGVDWPEVSAEIVDLITSRPRRLFSERVDRMFRYLKSIDYQPGQKLRLADSGPLGGFLAWTECLDQNEGWKFRVLIAEDGLCDGEYYSFRLTNAGIRRLEGLGAIGADSQQAFVAMWFGDQVSGIYDAAIEPAIRDAGFVPMRIDRKEHANKIDDEIIAEIRRSRFIVADFTCPVFETEGKMIAVARGGVYYEAGFAQGLGLPVIWMVREDLIDHTHFDTRQYAHITWRDAGDLYDKLFNRIVAVVGHLPTAPGRGASRPR